MVDKNKAALCSLLTTTAKCYPKRTNAILNCGVIIGI
jgi:hypothetical protein